MTKQQIAAKIVESIDQIASEIKQGRDVEIKTSSTGIKISSVERKTIR